MYSRDVHNAVLGRVCIRMPLCTAFLTSTAVHKAPHPHIPALKGSGLCSRALCILWSPLLRDEVSSLLIFQAYSLAILLLQRLALCLVLRASISQPHLWSPLLRPSQKIFMEGGWVQEKQCPIINCWDGLRRSRLCSFWLLLTSCMVQGNHPHLPGHTNSPCACSGHTLCS